MKAILIILSFGLLLPLVIWLLVSLNKTQDGARDCLKLTGHEQEVCMEEVKRASKPAEAVGKAVTGQN